MRTGTAGTTASTASGSFAAVSCSCALLLLQLLASGPHSVQSAAMAPRVRLSPLFLFLFDRHTVIWSEKRSRLCQMARLQPANGNANGARPPTHRLQALDTD